VEERWEWTLKPSPFDGPLYFSEMKALIVAARSLMMDRHSEIPIYTISIWTDPDAASSAVSFDTRENSQAKVDAANAWSKKHFDRLMFQGEPEEAQLFLPNEGRNCNPADFAFRSVVTARHGSFDEGWEELAGDECWELLEPAFLAVADSAREMFADLCLEPDAELGVNSRRDWYDQRWPLP
jgi:hypothetical protein